MQKKTLALAVSLLIASPFAAASTLVPINNYGFENGMNGWIEKDPASISSDKKSGSKSLKISGKPGRVSQFVNLKKNTRYQLQAWVKGSGQIFINAGNVGPRFKNAKFSVSNWTLVKLKFSSDNATKTEFGAKFTGSGDVRFDDFKLLDLDSNTPTPTPPAPTPTAPTPTPTTPTPTPTTPTPTPPTPTPTSSSGWDLGEWKLTLPESKDGWFGSGGSGTAELIPGGCSRDGSSFSNNTNNNYFDVRNSRMYFTVPLDGGTSTPNSSYIRSELRELYTWSPCQSNGDINTTWSPAGKHMLEASVRIDDYVTNTTPKVVVGQIHAHDVDQALVKLLWEGCSRPVRVILNERPGSDSAFSVNLGNVDCNSTWNYTVGIEDGDVVLSAGGTTRRLAFGGSDLVDDWEDETFYFKAGNYPQISKTNGGQFVVSFTKIRIDHD